jgi:hypothetical protein
MPTCGAGHASAAGADSGALNGLLERSCVGVSDLNAVILKHRVAIRHKAAEILQHLHGIR